MELPVLASSGALNFRFFFGGASFFGATTADATSGAGAMDADSLFIRQGKEAGKEADE